MKEIVDLLREKTKDIAQTDVEPLRQKLLAKKQLPALVRNEVTKPAIQQLSQNNLQELERSIETLVLKAYSSSTIKTYRNEFFQLLKEIKEIPVQNLAIEHVRRYIFYWLT